MTKRRLNQNVTLPPLETVLEQALRMSVDSHVVAQDFATCVYQDPIISAAILRRANSLEFANNRIPIVHLTSAVTRLGWENVSDSLRDLEKITQIQSARRSKWLELHRSKCRRAGMVARMLAEELAKDVTENCHTAALFTFIGDMVAVLKLGSIYVDLAENEPLSRVNYRMVTDYGLDTEQARTDYLLNNGVPQAIIEVIDKSTAQKETSHKLLRPIVSAAVELIEAFDARKFNKYQQIDELPSQSNLRILRIQPIKYERLIARIGFYLESDRALTETLKAAEQEAREAESRAQSVLTEASPAELAQKTTSVIKNEGPPPPTNEDTTQEDTAQEERSRLDKLRKLVERTEKGASSPEDSEDQEGPHHELLKRFNLLDSAKVRREKKASKVFADTPEESKKNATRKQSEKITAITKVIEIAEDAEQILALALTLLVQNGFENSALIVVDDKKSSALVLASRGKSSAAGQIIEISSPSSPLAQGFSKVQSTQHPSHQGGPLGSGTFALAPLEADHSSLVFLYCDNRKNGVISFEGRRIFRYIVSSVNARLPLLQGGLLIELPE